MIDPRAILSLAFPALCASAAAVCRRRLGAGFWNATLARASADLFLSGPVFDGLVFGLEALPFDLYAVQALAGLLLVVWPRAFKKPAAFSGILFFAALLLLATVLLSPYSSAIATYALLAARLGMFLYAAKPRQGTRANAVLGVFHASVVLPVLVGMPLLAAKLWNAHAAETSVFRGLAASVLALAGLVLLGAGTVEFSKRSATPDPSDASGRLITTGVYSLVRNPIQIGQILLIGSGTVWKGDHWIVFAVAAFEAAFLIFLIRPLEERHLASRFGGEFESYRARVPAYFPSTGRATF